MIHLFINRLDLTRLSYEFRFQLCLYFSAQETCGEASCPSGFEAIAGNAGLSCAGDPCQMVAGNADLNLCCLRNIYFIYQCLIG